MAPRPDPDHVPRIPLNKDRVLRAAVAFADDRGIESLTMRGLAAELGFEVMSLYNHVANKEDLFNGMVDLVAAEIDPPSDDAEWKTAVRRSAVSAHQALLRHPWAGIRWSSGWPGPARLRYMESLLRCLREAGFSVELTHHGFHALNTHIIGFTLQELNFAFDDEELGELTARFFREITAEEYPHLTEHAMVHLNGSEDDHDFEFVLEMILDGLDNARDAA